MPYETRHIVTVTYDEVFYKGNYVWFDDEGQEIGDIGDFLLDNIEANEEIEIVVKKYVKD